MQDWHMPKCNTDDDQPLAVLIAAWKCPGFPESPIQLSNQDWIITYPIDSPEVPVWRNGEMGVPPPTRWGVEGGEGQSVTCQT